MIVRFAVLLLLFFAGSSILLPDCFIMVLLKSIGISLCGLSQVAQGVTLQNAEDGFNALEKFYNQSNGLWVPSTGWWNSANCKLLRLTL